MRTRSAFSVFLYAIVLIACNPIHGAEDVKIRTMLSGNKWALVQGNTIEGYYSFVDDARAEWYNADESGYEFLSPGVLGASQDHFSLLYKAMPYSVEDGHLIIGDDKDGGFPIEIGDELTLLCKENGITFKKIVSFAGD